MTQTTTTCWRCGAELRPGDRSLCSVCMLEAARTPAPAPGAGPFAAPSLAELGQHFPHLEVLELIGQGGMGAVYRARQPRLDRDVALKVMRPEASGESAFTERFLREARVLARLSHPNVVGVHDFGVEGDLHWLMMEFVDGSNLREVLEAGKLPPEDAFALVPQICEALQYAHDHGVVHRDIKPENILLDASGRVRIADFGLARLDGGEGPLEDLRLTRSHEVFGTPRYMAPEQLEGARDVDHRADIYALGAVFYELLTGELPLGHFDPPSKRRGGVDERVDDVVMRALAKEPDRRFQRASEVGEAVRGIERGEAPPRPLARRPTPEHEDQLWGALCGACLILALVGVALVDSPFPLFLLFLPGAAFGATMAMPAIDKQEQMGAMFMLFASVGIAILSLVVHESGWGFLGLLAFGAGVGAGYAEERKHARELDGSDA
ncbi:MAG: serine/threonine-protein kinase [Planctomycetota bacterium]